LYCPFNQLSSLNIKNGNNTGITDFEARINPNLSCIQVDNVAYSNANWSSNIDNAAYFSQDCGYSSLNDFDAFGFNYYPNPVNDILTFSSNTPIENVIVSTMLGQEIKVNLSSDKTSVDLSNLPSGNYLVKVTIEEVAKTIKVVKQ